MERLHLGCGENYLNGYTNIDFSQDTTVQHRTRQPDVIGDFTKMVYESSSIAEVRLHHVFEHFQRHKAIKLLCTWNDWLVDGGNLVIAVPDIDRCISQYIKATSSRKRELIRHMWGSHEGEWATHHEGWTVENMNIFLKACGFEIKNNFINDGQWPEFITAAIKTHKPDYTKIENILMDYDYGDGMLLGWMKFIKDA
tara:strand:+ start:2219 stop:2809 length:591 start_codon:yes stop_codon:yes gene_type:complete